MINTLLPFNDSIETLRLQVFDMYCITPCQGGAFQSFSKLRRLRIPRELFQQWSEDVEDDPQYPDGYDCAPTIQTQLPIDLQKLHIDIGDDFTWISDDGTDDDPLELSVHAEELFSFLTGLADAEHFPELHELDLWTDEYEHSPSLPEKDPYQFPVICDQTRQFVTTMKDSGITVLFNGYSLEDFTARFEAWKSRFGKKLL